MSTSQTEIGTRQVPRHETLELLPKSSRYCVIVFVINEGTKVQKQLTRMRDAGFGLDVIVADGGSTDGSLEPEFLREAGVRTLLTKRDTGKLSAQMRMGFAYALDEGYEGVIVIDGNGKDGIEAIPEFARLLDEGYDHIQGSRFIPGGKAINTPRERLIALKLLHAPLISLAAGWRYTDTTNGFRGYSSRLLADPSIAVFRDVFDTYQLHYHLAIESARSPEYRCIETPVTRAYPKGKVPTKISPVRGQAHVLSVLFRAVLGRYRLRPERGDA